MQRIILELTGDDLCKHQVVTEVIILDYLGNPMVCIVDIKVEGHGFDSDPLGKHFFLIGSGSVFWVEPRRKIRSPGTYSTRSSLVSDKVVGDVIVAEKKNTVLFPATCV